MSEQLQELINKIKSEGLQKAVIKAKESEQQAREKAGEIVAEAEKKAGQIIARAQAENKKLEDSTRKILEQAARDMLLKLREEIQASLGRLIAQDVRESLAAEDIHEYILEVAKNYLKDKKDVEDITLVIKKEILEKLKKGYLSKLNEQIRLPIVLRSDEDMGSGFTISFDKGKSCFDFTDASLVEYLARFLNEEVVSYLKGASSNP